MEWTLESIRRLFSSDYRAARALFIGMAQLRNCRQVSFEQSSPSPGEEELLTVDVAHLGPLDAPNVVFIVSGTHGVEGFCGSAIQSGLLADDLALACPDTVALVFVHAINPFGFAHRCRTNEDNIDLNRNFVNHQNLPEETTAYAEFHSSLLDWDMVTPLAAEPVIAEFLRSRGRNSLLAALTSGQYAYPDGLFYGGRGPSWSNQLWRRIVREQAAAARRVAVIDIHTGLGEEAAIEKILLAGALSTGQQLFGTDVRDLGTGASSASSKLSGTLVGATSEESDAAVAGIALEIGTVPVMQMLDALRMDNWLRQQQNAPQSLTREIRQKVQDCFCINSDAWRQAAWWGGRATVACAIAALAELEVRAPA